MNVSAVNIFIAVKGQMKMQQITLDYFKPHYSINQPVRLIELFAGIGSQAKALQKLGVDFEKWVISEWEVNATKSYKAIHCENDNTDYSKGINQKELINALFSMGISNDGKEPMTLKQIARKNEKWLRETYNAYKATHNISNLMLAAGKDLNIVDIEKYVYILTYSFPCQDLSIAGKQAGMTKGSKTRSGLLWEVERLMKECENLPQVLLMENVTQVHNKKNFADFKKWVECLEDLGYSNYYADLNAKDYGVPQNRNRTFMISILGDYYYQFPEPFKLQKRLKDILEKDVDEKHYVSPKICKFVTDPFRIKKKYTTVNADVASSLKARDYANWNGNFIADNEVIGSTQKNAYRGSLDGPSPALTTAMGEGGGNIPMIIEVGDSIDINYPNSETRKGRHLKNIAHNIGCQNNSQVVVVDDTYKDREERKYADVCPTLRSGRSGFKVQTEPYIAASRGRNPDNPSDRTAGIELEQRLEVKADGISNTLTTVLKDNLVVEPVIIDDFNSRIPKEQNIIGTLTTNIGNRAKHNGIKIIEPKDFDIQTGYIRAVRRLTPKECLRLMTFDDADYEKIKAAGISDSAIYKQAGNSIVVNVMVFIFAMLFDIKVNFYEV